MANGINLRDLRREIKKESVIFTRPDLLDAWRRTPAEDVRPFALDGKEYVGLPQDVWDMILVHLGIYRYTYVRDRSDCDDFALAVRGRAPLELKANGVGAVIDFSGGHGYNAFLIPDSGRANIKFVEPQARDGWWVEEPGKDGMYDLDFGYVIW